MHPSKHPISVKTINQSYCWVLPQTFPKNNLPRAIFYGKRCFIAKRGKHVFAEMGNSTRPTNPINDMNGTLPHIYGQKLSTTSSLLKANIYEGILKELKNWKSPKLIFDFSISFSGDFLTGAGFSLMWPSCPGVWHLQKKTDHQTKAESIVMIF